MRPTAPFELITPRDTDLGIRWVGNAAGLAAGVLPNAALFALEHRHARGATLISQVLGSHLAGGIARIVLRRAGAHPVAIEAMGPSARVRLGIADDRILWEGETAGLRHRVTLALDPDRTAWTWTVEIEAGSNAAGTWDALLVQDLGLGGRGFLMNNEAFGSQYTDHHVAPHERFGPVLMSRQALAQDGAHPWILHACLDGAASFATDLRDVFGPAFRDRDALDPSHELPGVRLQHEAACAALRTEGVDLAPGGTAVWTFAAVYVPDHPTASTDADLAHLDGVTRPTFRDDAALVRHEPRRGVFQDAPSLAGENLDATAIAARWPVRRLEEHAAGRLQSFFLAGDEPERHVVLREKDAALTRRHGIILRSGPGLMPDGPAALCATAWMHGVFAAQLTLGNTSFHKLFSVSRDAYGITRGSGLRILVDIGAGWRMLATPSAFEMGLADARWIYRLADRTIEVRLLTSGEDAAMVLDVTVEGPPCRFLVTGHLVLGERELDHTGRVTIDPGRVRATFRPDPGWLWAERFPDARLDLVTSTPDVVEAIGGEALLGGSDGVTTSHVALRTTTTRHLRLAVTGALADADAAIALADRCASADAAPGMLATATAFWRRLHGHVRVEAEGRDTEALATALPWMVQNAVVHLSVPHGLEQYTGAAWGTRDVCQGPVELLLPLGHTAPVREILVRVFEQQYAERGDWPQWFMLDPYPQIQDRHAHGDVAVWPLKALCDYLEATDDVAFLETELAWRDEATLLRTAERASVRVHVDKLLATLRAALVPGTALIRYGEGDWNDSLQPADPRLRERMVSSWTVALLYQQLGRWGAILRRIGDSAEADAVDELRRRMREDVHRHLLRDGVLAGYAIFGAEGEPPELLLHPSDTRTGPKLSLIGLTRSVIAGLVDDAQAAANLAQVEAHLLCPDGVRLMDRPPVYRGGIETIFRRAESAAYVGREIGLMYVHAHLRWAEALHLRGDQEGVWRALRMVDPVGLAEHVPNAAPRQRNVYFSSSDAAFADRYAAGSRWDEVRRGEVPVEGGWRVYSSGPGLFVRALLTMALRPNS